MNSVLCQKGGSMSPSTLGQNRFYVKGQQVELWENPQYPFGTTVSDMERYCINARWDLLFNAVVIVCLASCEHDEDEDSSIPERTPWYLAGDTSESRGH